VAQDSKTEQSYKLWEVLEKYAKYIGIIGAIISVVSYSQGNRLASYISLVVGYVLIAQFLWRVITQKSLPKQPTGIVLPSTISLGMELKPRYSRRQRWMATAGLTIFTLLTVGWVGVNGWQDIQRWRAKNIPPVQPAQDDEVLVIISQFENRGSAEQEIDFAQRIHDALDSAGIKNVRPELLPPSWIITGKDEARELGKDTGAALVIWGWFDGIGATPSYEITKNPEQIKQVELEESPSRISEPDRFSIFVRTELPQGMTYLTAFTIGQVYYLAGQDNEALTYFYEAISALPQEKISSWGEEYTYFYTGATLAKLGRPSVAMGYYRTAISHNDNFAEAYNNLGVSHSALRDYKRAIENFDMAVNLGLYVAYYNRGNAYYHQGKTNNNRKDLEQAIKDYTKFLEYVDPSYYYVTYYNRGLTYAELQNHELAIKDFTQAIELAPEPNPDFFLARAGSYSKLCRYEDALKDFSRVIDEELEIDEDARVKALTCRGATYTRLGHYSNAVKDYQDALLLNPNYAPTLYNLAATRALEGNDTQAIEMLTSAIELSPDLATTAACDSDFDSIRNHDDLQILAPPSEGCQPDLCR